MENFRVYSTWKNPRGKFPRVLRVFISTSFPRGQYPRHFHVEISMWKISACNLRGKIHVENFHADYLCSFLPLFHLDGFHVTSTRKISTRIICVNFYLFSTWKFTCGKCLCVFYVEKSTWKIFTCILVHFCPFFTRKIFIVSTLFSHMINFTNFIDRK